MNRYKYIVVFIFYFIIAGCDSSFLKWELRKLAIVETTEPVSLPDGSVQCSGNVKSDGGSFVIEKGICYSTLANPTIENNKVIGGSGTGTFNARIEGLTPGINYFFRAYAVTKAGTAYGNETMLIKENLATLVTNSVVSITSTTAVSGGKITNSGGSDVIERGICYSTTVNPTLSDNKVGSGSGTGEFTVNLNGLAQGTTYYLRAYATNSSGTAYGNEISFTTLSVLFPTISTTAASSITTNSAVSGGNITNNGGSAVTTRGVCYSTSHNPTISGNRVDSGSGTGIFTVNLSGLTPATTYFIRAYATNNSGTAYGNEISFTTSSLILPTVSTVGASLITTTSAVSGGNVSSEGGSAVTERGICYNTSPNPSLSNNHISSGLGIGNFSVILNDLTPGTIYYIRAYATNSAGTAYGNEVSFTTTSVLLPTLNTTGASSITTTSAVSGGNVTSDGGGPVTARGICYSTSTNPTISDNRVNGNSGIGNFISNLNGLTPGTTYYIRAFATNSAGTAYGNQVSFSTLAVFLPVLNTAAATSITNNSAVSGGNISYDGGGTVIRGVCYSTSSNPTLSNNVVPGGSGTGSFNVTITGLILGTTYYIRAYATNSAGTAYVNEIGFRTTSILSIGLNFQGGIIFYLDGTSNHGLIAAPSDQSLDAKWGCSGTSISNTNNTSVGTGSGNTSSIVAGCSDSGIAAKLCYNLSLNGYDDWYLPSKDELNLMYLNLREKNIGNFKDEDYWSSSQDSEKDSWLQSFQSGKTSTKNKNSSMSVRAIRSF